MSVDDYPLNTEPAQFKQDKQEHLGADCKHIHLTKIVNCGPTDYVCEACRLHFHTLPGLKPITVINGVTKEPEKS